MSSVHWTVSVAHQQSLSICAVISFWFWRLLRRYLGKDNVIKCVTLS
jgi:hypothetical protein